MQIQKKVALSRKGPLCIRKHSTIHNHLFPFFLNGVWNIPDMQDYVDKDYTPPSGRYLVTGEKASHLGQQ